MSGVVRSVKKIFKKVAKVVKKVAPYAVAAAAVFFTVSGAMGNTPGGWGGWGTAADRAAINLFGEGLLADTVSGALTQAGIGAIAGGAIGAVTDTGFEKGMQYGAAGGAVTGAVTGAMSAPIKDPGALWGGNAAGVDVTGVPSGADVSVGKDSVMGTSAGPDLSNLAPVSQPVPSLDALTPGKEVRTGLLGFWDEVKNSELASGMVGGTMQAVGGMLTAGDDEYGRIEAAEVKADAERQARRDAWIGTAGQGGLLTQSSSYASSDPTPGDKWNYKVDPTTKQITGV